MNHDTNIDTVGIQIDASSMEEQNMIRFMLCRAIQEHNNVYIKFNYSLQQDEILCNSNKIGSIKLGIIPLIDSYTKLRYLKYYIVLKFAGLKRYNSNLDNLSYSCLLTACKALNTFNEPFKFTEIDICLDMHTDIQSTLAICTRKLPRTEYHPLTTSFYKGNTYYLEKYDKYNYKNISQRSYLYNKAEKEGLSFPLTRFELKLQKPFFFKEDFGFERIIKAINSYKVMYFNDINEKYMIINKYNSYSRIAMRDINKMELEKYSIKPDINKIINFITILKTVKYY